MSTAWICSGSSRRGAAGLRSRGRRHPPGGRRIGPRPRPQHDPLRHQAFQPAGEYAGRGEDFGPGPGAVDQSAGWRPPATTACGHGRLPGPGTGHGRGESRPPGRHLFPGLHAVFPVDRPSALPGRFALRTAREASDARAAEHCPSSGPIRPTTWCGSAKR